MKYPILFFIVFLLNGCILPKQLDESTIKNLSNDDLCRALGEFNHHGSSILAIHKEIEKRAPGIDLERCFALEKSVISNSKYTGEYEPCVPYGSLRCLPDVNQPPKTPQEIYDKFGTNHINNNKKNFMPPPTHDRNFDNMIRQLNKLQK